MKWMMCQIAIMFCTTTLPSSATSVGYFTEGDETISSIYSVDLNSGKVDLFCTTIVPQILSLAISPTNGNFYGFAATRWLVNNYRSSELFNIAVPSGVATKIMDLPTIPNWGQMAFAPDGSLFIFDSHYDSKQLLKIDVTNASSLVVGNVFPEYTTPIKAFTITDSGVGLAWGGRYGITQDDRLYQIDLTNGNTTDLGKLPGDFTAFAYADGNLYGWNGTNKSLYWIDVDKLTSHLIPEPVTFSFFVLSGLSLLRHRKS